MEIVIKPKITAIVLLSIIGFLIITNAVALYLQFGLDRWAFGLVPMFKLTLEGNIPTFFSSLIWLVTSLLFCVISLMVYKEGAAYLKHWIGLSLIGLFLALDESAQIHEIFDRNREWTNGLFKPDGVLIGPWVVVYGALTLAFVISYLKFYTSFSNRYKIIFGSAGLIFVSGAIGLEMVGGHIWTADGTNALMFEVINSIEEVMEMVGVSMTIYGLILYINEYFGTLRVLVNNQTSKL